MPHGSTAGRYRSKCATSRRPIIDRLENRVLFSTAIPTVGTTYKLPDPSVVLVPQIAPLVLPNLKPAVPRGYVPPPKLVNTRIAVTPTGLALADGTSFQYSATAYDQNGNVIAVPPAFNWTVLSGGAGGSINSLGLFTAPASATGASTIQVTAGTAKTTAVVNLTAPGVLTVDGDVGSPVMEGHYSYNGSVYTVTGNGSDIWNSADQFNFASTSMTGDSVAEARVTSVGSTDPWAKAGIMFRESSAANSADVYLIETPAGVVQLLQRTAAGVAATTVGQATVSTTMPIWLKLVRDGNSFTGYWATDGTTWNQLGTATSVNMDTTVMAGLVASSHTSTTLSTSTFDNVQMMSQPTTGIYRIAAKVQPNLSLDIIGFGNANETGVQIWNANYTSNQQWLVQEQGDGTYKIYAYSGENSFQMLDLTNGSTANGNLVNTYTDNGNTAQRWILIPETGGYFRIVPKNGENTLATLDIQNGTNAIAGARTDIFSYGGGSNQQFALSNPGTLQVLPSPKKGLAGNLTESSSIHNAWGYDWGSNGGGAVPASVEYDPMAWGYYGNSNNSFTNFVNGLATGGAKDILGFNEPDNSGQANLTVASALQGWGAMQGAGVPLISPACVDDTDSWMQSFMSGAAAAGYRVDAVAIHWYGGDDPTGFINYVNEVHNLYNKPIWITEFCPADWSGNGGVSVANATSFMETVIPELNSMSFVQRYSWFSASTTDPDLGQGALFNSNGSLTALGSVYSRM